MPRGRKPIRTEDEAIQAHPTDEMTETSETSVAEEPVVAETEDMAGIAPVFEETRPAPEEPGFATENEQVQVIEAASSERPFLADIPMTARISSLEMEGATRAFAVAEYGDLTIRRIRVKEDAYGGLSATMPKFREAGGFTDTCHFNTAESRNRLGALVLDAYHQALRQIQDQTVPRQEQTEPEISAPEMDAPEQEPGPEMGMRQW
jgi:DNA-binding cell septation regulator SpoVG